MRGINEETFARSEETQSEFDSFPGSGGTSRAEGENIENQQERDYRADSQRPKPDISGTSISGGMLDQLIGQFSDQLVEQQRVIAQAQENIEKLSRRIQECKELKAELDKQLETIEQH